MTAQLRLWDGDDAVLAGDPRVVLSIRESRRAHQLILQALPPRTVELVVPRGVRADVIEGFVREHRAWIDRAGAEMLAAYPEPDLKPATIDLPATGARVAIHYLPAAAGRGRYRYGDGELRLHCVRPDQADGLPLMRRWLLEQGRQVLKPWIEREAARTGLQPKRVQIRLQKTRWGSCSARGNVSLNAALLLVPPELVRYLFVHELCHLEVLSHSRRYWRTVARHEPDYRELDRRLARSWRQLPAWLFALTHGEFPC
jgi:hypothetical protein